MRRLLDIIFAALALAVLALPLLVILILVWSQDRHSPFYIADRVGRGGASFRMVKIRSMIVNADRTGVESTSASDKRITPLGHFIRRWKVDELSQLWNVLKGDMSLVGPRPNTVGEVKTYADWERELTTVRPGITDLSSIVFSDEGEILKESADPDADYARLIRPWKGALGIIYVRNASVTLNLVLIWITVLAIIDKRQALVMLQQVLRRKHASPLLCQVARRDRPLADFTEYSAQAGQLVESGERAIA